MPQFEFADFVDEFAVSFVAHEQSKGSYDNKGKWIPGTTTAINMVGIILPHVGMGHEESEGNDLKDSGNHQSIRKKIYTKQPMQLGTIIDYEGQSLTVDGGKSYYPYADVYIYLASGVVK